MRTANILPFSLSMASGALRFDSARCAAMVANVKRASRKEGALTAEATKIEVKDNHVYPAAIFVKKRTIKGFRKGCRGRDSGALHLPQPPARRYDAGLNESCRCAQFFVSLQGLKPKWSEPLK